MKKIVRWKLIRHLWEAQSYTYNKLAEEFDISLSSIKSRKSREKWDRDNPLPYDREAEDKEIVIKEANAHKRAQEARDKAVNEAQKLANKSPVKIVREADSPISVSYTREDGQEEEVQLLEYLYDESDNLTEQQRLFCYHYLVNFNATKAYQKAYSCSYNSAKTQGNLLMKNPYVAQKLQKLKSENAHALQIDARTVLQKYVDIAMADITDYVEFGKQVKTVKYPPKDDQEEGMTEEYYINYVDLKDSKDVDGTIITEIRQGRDGVSIRLADKMKALEFLAKYTDVLNNATRKELEEEKLRVEIEAKKNDMQGGSVEDVSTVIVANEDEMRRVIAEKKAKEESTNE